MTAEVFCYHCRSHHRGEEMIFIEAKGRQRWRCRKSIAVGRTSHVLRDAFGRSVSERNQEKRRLSLPHCVLELLA